MKYLAVVALFLCAAPAAEAQLLGMPVWNDPNAGSTIMISGDVGFPDDDGFGNVYAARGNASLGGLQLGATVGVHDPDGEKSVTGFGGTLGYKLFGMVLPVAINAQGGVATEDHEAGRFTRVTAAVGLGVKAPVPGLDLHAWVSPGVRFLRFPTGVDDSDTDTNFGVAIGASVGFGLLGIHAGYDRENAAGDEVLNTFGVGLHLGLGLPSPVGMGM